jgi:REP element-mobilizing transposase RayT
MNDKYKNKYRIAPNRWQNWDYSAPGDYFITIVIQNRESILGEIQHGKMILSDYGKIVQNEFLKINDYDPHVQLDEFVIMPNHIHFILNVEKIHEFSLRSLPPSPSPTTDDIKQYRKMRRNMLVIKILGKFQQQTSKQINIMRNTPGTKNWQRDFYDHVIRNNEEYVRIKEYIIKNPQNWENDRFMGT